MATEAQFRAHATLVKSHAAATAELARSLPEWADNTGLSGGAYEPVIVNRLQTEWAQVRVLAAKLAALANEFDRRADACGAYRRALDEWRGDVHRWQRRVNQHRIAVLSGLSVPHPGSPPPKPRPPFPEAEVA